MADQLLTGTTLVENTSRSVGDVPVGGILEWDDTFANLPVGFVEANGSTINDPLSSYNGVPVPNYNTNFLSIHGTEFAGQQPDTDDVTMNLDGMTAAADNLEPFCPVGLPEGAVVTGVIVYGDTAWGNWFFHRNTFSDGSTDQMAAANINTEDTSISTATVDNQLYAYVLSIGSSTFDIADKIFGAVITYTPRQKFIIRIR